MGYREVFIFVAGTTPQIITETLYALHHGEPSIDPDEIHIITTTIGKAVLEEELLHKGRLGKYFREFDVRHVEPDIHLLTDLSGRPLDDIRTARDNEDAGDFIVRFVGGMARDGATRLHCSIAGGRKTMSFYLGSAMTLLGRAQDRLYHVLVTPDFESVPEFYWKPGENTIIEVRDDKDGLVRELDTSEARIYLAELPYLRLRDKFTLEGRLYKELVREGQKEINAAAAQPDLCVDLGERTLLVGSAVIEIVPMQLVVYSAFLREKLKMCRYEDRPYCAECTDCYLLLQDLSTEGALEEMAGDYARAYGDKPLKAEEFKAQWPGGMSVEAVRQNISKINRVIMEHLVDETISSFCTVRAVGKYGSKRYGVKAEKGKIRIL